MSIQLNENRRPDLSSIDEFAANDPSAFRNWIRDRLHGEDTRVPDDPKQDVGQYYLIGAIYDDLDPETQAEIRRALKHFLHRMEEGDDAWKGDAAHSLLHLTRKLGESELAEPVVRMAREEQFLDGNDRLHDRLLQTLNFLQMKMGAEFWMRQVDVDASRFGVPAFTGMRLRSLDEALGRVLPKLDLTDESLRRRLKREVRGLLSSDRYTQDDLRKIIRDLERHGPLSDEAFNFLRDALPELKLQPKSTEGRPLTNAVEFLDEEGQLDAKPLGYEPA
jgi:hypothetical protein